MKNFFFVFLSLLTCLFAIAAGFIAADYLYYQNTILPGYFIENVDVGGLTKEEAYLKLKNLGLDKTLSTPITLVLENRSVPFLPSKVGAVAKIEDSVDEAYSLSHQSFLFQLVWQRISKKEVHVPLKLSLNETAVKDFFASLSKAVNSPPQDARVSLEGLERVVITKEKFGRSLEADSTIQEIKAALKENRLEVPLHIAYTPPKIFSRPLLENPPVDVLGEFTTYYGRHDSPNRIHNIKLVAGMINNKIIMPEQTFSLIETVGEITKDRGFKEAFVIIGDALTPEAGGGTCQIATTLYNSVMLADLEVLQRSNHAVYFSIYPLGRDAAVYPPYTDFKFKDSTLYPIAVQAFADKKKLTIRIFGTSEAKKVYFSAPQETPWERKAEKKDENEKPFAVKVKRTVLQNNKMIKEEVIRSFYRLHGDKDKVKIERPEPR